MLFLKLKYVSICVCFWAVDSWLFLIISVLEYQKSYQSFILIQRSPDENKNKHIIFALLHVHRNSETEGWANMRWSMVLQYVNTKSSKDQNLIIFEYQDVLVFWYIGHYWLLIDLYQQWVMSLQSKAEILHSWLCFIPCPTILFIMMRRTT